MRKYIFALIVLLTCQGDGFCGELAFNAFSSWGESASGDPYISDGSLGDIILDSIVSWSDDDNVNGVSTQTTFDGVEVFSFATNAAAGSNWAARSKDIGDGASPDFTLTYEYYLADIGTIAGNNYENFQFRITSTTYIDALSSTDGYYVNNNSGYTEIGTDIISEGTWITMSFRCDLSAGCTCDLYQKNSRIEEGVSELVQSGFNCKSNGAGLTPGQVLIYQFGYTAANQQSYNSRIIWGTGLTGD